MERLFSSIALLSNRVAASHVDIFRLKLIRFNTVNNSVLLVNLATFHARNGCTWLAATILDGTELVESAVEWCYFNSYCSDV